VTATPVQVTEQTQRVLGAHRTLSTVLDAHPELAVEAVAVEASAVADTARITIVATPRPFLAWCQHLDVAQVRLHRDDHHIRVATDPVRVDGLMWHVRAAVPRSADLKASRDLPGEAQVTWIRDAARIGVARLRVALTARGMA
jgi:hypothetical protein